MDTDLASRLDRSIGPAPDTGDALAALLSQGHRVVRRRRVTVAVATTAAVVVVAGGLAAAAVGGPERADAPIVAPTGTATTSTTAPATPQEQADDLVDPAAVAPADHETAPSPAQLAAASTPMLAEFDSTDPPTGRRLHVRDGVDVLRELDDPWPVLKPPAVSAGLAARFQGHTWWLVAYLSKNGGGSYRLTWAGDTEGLGFEDWVRAQATTMLAAPDGNGPESDSLGTPADGLVHFDGATERLVAATGAEILEQRAGVDVGESFAGPGDRTAAARVHTPTGDVLYVLVRAFQGESSQVIAVPLAKGGPDLDAFLELARQRYADGVGLL